jgi:hypothetical protein
MKSAIIGKISQAGGRLEEYDWSDLPLRRNMRGNPGSLVGYLRIVAQAADGLLQAVIYPLSNVYNHI